MSLMSAFDLVVSGEAPSTRWLHPSGRDPRRHVVVLRHPAHRAAPHADLTLTNRVLSAEEAESWGLVNRVVADDDVDTATVELATTFAGATSALGEAKRWSTTASTPRSRPPVSSRRR